MSVSRRAKEVDAPSANPDQALNNERPIAKMAVPGATWLTRQAVSGLYSAGRRLWAAGNWRGAWSCYERALTIGNRFLPAEHLVYSISSLRDITENNNAKKVNIIKYICLYIIYMRSTKNI